MIPPSPRVLITRPEPEATATALRIQARGYEPIIAPLMQITHLPVEPFPRVQAVIVTSGNALSALTPSAVPLLAVGDATAVRARTQGWPDVRSAGGDATALAAMAVATLAPEFGPVLLACGRGQGQAIQADLRAHGFQLVRREVYAATQVPAFPTNAADALRARALYAAVFMSGETAAAFVRLLPPALLPSLANVLALAIGNAAAKALNPLKWRQVRLAAAPTLDGVLALL